jgi:hypothetical protein
MHALSLQQLPRRHGNASRRPNDADGEDDVAEYHPHQVRPRSTHCREARWIVFDLLVWVGCQVSAEAMLVETMVAV